MDRRALSAALCALIALAACGKGNQANRTDALDKSLLAGANAADPAMTGSLKDQIVIDPRLAGKAGHGANAKAGAKGADGALLHAPAPTPASQAARAGVTLGELARTQGAPAAKPNPKCDKTFRQDVAWANRLPDALPLYPGAAVSEAAGNDSPGCRVRIVSFTAPAPVDRVIDYYYTKVVHAGYSAEHQVAQADHILGGAREADGSAYYIVVTAKGRGSAVDIIANHGR